MKRQEDLSFLKKIEKLICTYQWDVKKSDADIKRSMENCVCTEQFLNDEFKCMICQGLAYLPKSCKTCHGIYCEVCISKWAKTNLNRKGASCPQCRSPLTILHLDEAMDQKLQSMTLKGCPEVQCGLSGQQIKYKRLINHLKFDCAQIQVQCPLPGCEQLFRMQDWQSHLQQCEKISLYCNDCEVNILKMENINKHNCVNKLKEKLIASNVTISDLQEELKQSSKLLQERKQNEEQQKRRLQELENSTKEQQTFMKYAQSRIMELEEKLKNFEMIKAEKEKYESVLKKQMLSNNVSRATLEPIRRDKKINMEAPQKPLFKLNDYLFCHKHQSQLSLITAKTHGAYQCNTCHKSMRQNAMDKGEPVTEFTGQCCRMCNITLCRDCISTNAMADLVQ